MFGLGGLGGYPGDPRRSEPGGVGAVISGGLGGYPDDERQPGRDERRRGPEPEAIARMLDSSQFQTCFLDCKNNWHDKLKASDIGADLLCSIKCVSQDARQFGFW